MIEKMRNGRQEKMALIANPACRSLRKNPKMIKKMEEIFSPRGSFLLAQTPEELPRLLTDVVQTHTEILFVCGGDGTLRRTLHHLCKASGQHPLPLIAIIKSGTMNTVAASLEIPRSGIDHLTHLLDRMDRSLPHFTTPLHLLKVNSHYGFIFSVGGFSNFIRRYEATHNTSTWMAAKLSLQTTLSVLLGTSLGKKMFSKFPALVWRNSQPLVFGSEVTTIAAASISHIGFHFKPFYGAHPEEETFSLLVLRDSPKPILYKLPSILRGKPIFHKSIIQLPSQEVLIKLEEPMVPMMDGDLLEPKQEFHLSLGPKLEMIIG